MSKNSELTNVKRVVNLVEMIDSQVDAQALFLTHLTIEDFPTNRKLFDRIVMFNKQTKVIVAEIVSMLNKNESD